MKPNTQWIIAAVALAVGCLVAKAQDPAKQPPAAAATASANFTFEARTDLEKAVQKVLTKRGFKPAAFLPGPDGLVWAVTSRERSSERSTLHAIVAISATQRGMVHLVGFGGPDGTAILGRLFQGPIKAEAAEIEKEIDAETASQR